MTENLRFKQVLAVEITILVVCVLCYLPAAVFISMNGVPRPAQAAAGPEQQTVEQMQTAVAELSGTLEAPESVKAGPQIPVTGVKATEAPEGGPLYVTFIDTGQGDAILIQTADGKFGLIDGGPAGGKALKYLQSHGVERLELVVASVPRPEHIGGLVEILRVIPVGHIVTNGQTAASPVYEEFLDAVADSGAVHKKARRGDAFYIGSQRLDVLHPGAIIAQDLAVNSLVLRLAHEKNVFMFMSDAANIPAQEMTATVFPLNTTVLKVGHHAGRQALSPDFLNAARPRIAVYSPGAGDDYDLPSSETIAALESAGAEVFGTDSSGTVMVISSAAGCLAAAEFENPRTPSPAVEPAAEPGADLPVVVTGITNPVQAGQEASISIETAPGAICTNVIKFSTGRGGMAHMGTRVADQSGAVGWSWRVGPDATPGAFLIDILCGLDGRSAGGVTPFVVMR